MSARWSIGRRTGTRFALFGASFLVAVGSLAVGGYALILQGQLDEELEEQLAPIRAGDRDRAAGHIAPLLERLEAVAATGGEEPLAFEVLDGQGGALAAFGPPDLVAALSSGPPPRTTVERRPGSVRRVAWVTRDGFLVHAALDGSAWSARVRWVAVGVGGVVLVGALLALVTGRAFGSGVAGWLEEVSRAIDSRRQETSVSGPELTGAPDEIRAVAESLDASMRAAARETERAALLSSGLAHDLRSPVQSLLTGTQVTLAELGQGDATRDLLERHLVELRGLAQTIDNIVAWGVPRTDGSRGLVFDLGDEIERRLGPEESTAAGRGVLLDVERRGSGELTGDPDALALAVRNLVGNAVAWSPPGELVRVTVLGESGRVVVHVDDAGRGVPEAERARIFEPFVRGAAAPGRRAGYGLGLAIATRAAARHNGSLSVIESPMGGARFTLTLPRDAASTRT